MVVTTMPSEHFGVITYTTGAILTLIGVLFATGSFISLTTNPSGHASGIAVVVTVLTVLGGILFMFFGATKPSEES